MLTLLVDAISKKSLAENPLIKERLDAGLHNYEYRTQLNDKTNERIMPNLNRVLLIGNLTRDPEMQYTAKGTAITTLWGNLAENTAKYLNKGKPVYIEGRLQLDQWDDKQTGQKRSKLKVVAESMQFLGSRDNNGGPAPAAASPPTSGTVRKPQRHPDLNHEPDDIPF